MGFLNRPLAGSLMLMGLVLMSPPAVAEPAMSTQQLKALRAAGPMIALPGYVPTGFHVDQVLIQALPDGPGGGISYVVVYSGPNGTFGVEAVSGGIGGPDLPVAQRVKVPGFGNQPCDVYFTDAGDGKKTYITQWLGNGPFYRIVGANYLHDQFPRQCFESSELNTATIGHITASLRLKKI